ncbi:MAG: hypothetical protein U0694_04730 [Anaerolineae bacterium]
MMRILVTFVVLLCLLPCHVEAQSAVTYGYAYAVHREEDDFYLQVINPTTEEAESIFIPAREGHRIFSAQASPDGEWVYTIIRMLDSSTRPGGSYSVNLYSPRTGEMREVLYDVRILKITWSPDSQWLALILRDAESINSFLGAYVYHVATAALSMVSADETTPYHMEWSPDSTQLLTVGMRCPTELHCSSRFDVIEMSSITSLHSVEFDSSGDYLCQFAWSPDNQTIAFLYACSDSIGSGSWPYIHDIYSLNLANSTFTRLTYFAQQEEYPSTLQQYSLGYSFAWYDSSTLLRSMAGGPFQDGVGFDDAFYLQESVAHRADGTQVFIADQSIWDWILNPLYPTEIAFRREDYVLFTTEYNTRLAQVANAAVEIATFDGTNLNVLYSGVGGCELDWSPDGTMLAYSYIETLPHYDCWSVMGFEFVSRETWTSSSFRVTEAIDFSAGWVIMPAD